MKLTLCSIYLHGIETKFNKTVWNDNIIDFGTSKNNNIYLYFHKKYIQSVVHEWKSYHVLNYKKAIGISSQSMKK